MKTKTKTKKASALIFALITLTAMLVVAVASFEASVIDQKAATDTEKSVSSFQAADSGIEIVMQKIKTAIEDPLLGSSATLEEAGLCVGSAALYSDTTSISGKIIKVEYRDSNNEPIISSCDIATVSDIKYLRSTGEFGGTIRAVQVYVRNNPCGGQTQISYEGQDYDLVEIGDQCWFAENLNVYDVILNGNTSPSDNSRVEKWCYNNTTTNCDSDGGLYSWSEALGLSSACGIANCSSSILTNHQGICPLGWHIPSDDDFKEMEEYLGMSSADLDSFSWRSCSGCGTELRLGGTTGFDAITAGQRTISFLFRFIDRGEDFYMWVATQDTIFPMTRGIYRSLTSDSPNDVSVLREQTEKLRGFSVRCVKN